MKAKYKKGDTVYMRYPQDGTEPLEIIDSKLHPSGYVMHIVKTPSLQTVKVLEMDLTKRKPYEEHLQEQYDSDPFEREEVYNEDVYDDDEIDEDPNLERGWKNRD